MFWRLYKYGLLTCVRQKMMVFWSLLFPVALGTLFQMSFGGAMDSIEFQKIPTAYVVEEGADATFTELLESLEKDSELVEVYAVTKEEAERLLKEEDVEGIFYNSKDDGITLTVTEQGINQSILSSILEQYERTFSTFTNIGREAPQKIAAAASLLEEESRYLKEENISEEPKSDMMDFFYTLIAMNCLMGATAGVACASNFKADLSALGARRVIASTNRLRILFSDLAAYVTVQFVYTTFSVLYLMYVLKAPFGNHLGMILLIAFLGNLLSVFLGFFIGLLGGMSETLKEGISVMFMLTSSFLSGLMLDGMYRIVDTYAPVVHLVNPASLIVNALRSLDIYDTYEIYVQCAAGLVALTVLLGAGAYVMVRRERYASI